ncbi:MAG: hypothetical protein HY321_23110 [Armatimonadetes bacterium]|nr:hypothetical protein [Armatimonadota bacterium]
MRRKRLLMFWGGLALFAGLVPVGAQSKCTMVAIPGLAGDQSCMATGVNTAGHVVGTSSYPGPERAWYRGDDGVLRDLGNFGVRSDGFQGCGASAINNHDVVVGTSFSPDANKTKGTGLRHAFVCRNPGDAQPRLEDLNTLGLAGPKDAWLGGNPDDSVSVWDGYANHRGFMFKEAYGINDSNLVTGEGWLFTGWYPDPDLPATILLGYVANLEIGTFVLTDKPAQLGAINAAGLAVGGPYLYNSADGTSVQLQGMATACDLTDLGLKIAGYFYPVVWARACYKPGLDAPVQDLGTLGGNYSFALSISEVTTGEGVSYGTTLVGNSSLTKSLNNPPMAAFRWQPGSGIVNLNKLLPKGTPYTLREARKITSNGLIVGTASVKNGGSSGYLLIPQ